jgi:hypothetical protein
MTDCRSLPTVLEYMEGVRSGRGILWTAELEAAQLEERRKAEDAAAVCVSAVVLTEDLHVNVKPPSSYS